MKNILIIDDDKNIAILIKNALLEQGHSVESVVSSSEMRKVLTEKKIDLVLLDLNLPETNGSELLVEIKKDYPEVKVIIISAEASLEKAVALMKKGASDYIKKPFAQHKIVAKVTEILSNS